MQSLQEVRFKLESSYTFVLRARSLSRKRVQHKKWFTNVRTVPSCMNDLQTNQDMSLRETFRAHNDPGAVTNPCAKLVDRHDA